jgi:hypothetical protein
VRTEFENFGNMEAFFLEKLKRENIGHEIVTVIRSDGCNSIEVQGNMVRVLKNMWELYLDGRIS